ncbi:MAG: neutral zinc metallopeptidase [Gemmatimonadaceae bacterium]
MRWSMGGDSSNVEDRRGSSGGFGGGGMRLGLGGTVVLLVLSAVFHKDFFALVGGGDGSAATQADGSVAPVRATPQEDSLVQFVTFVLNDDQTTWAKLLPDQAGVQYQAAHLVLFRDGIQTGCGTGQTAMGPFYCPLDHKVYIDLGFYDELRRRFGAPGDFAQAYVIAHELGHHVQTLVGIDQRMRRAQQANPGQANALSVRLELQADCFAGVWGHSTQERSILEQGDVQEALAAASAVGDDRIQKQQSGRINTDTFTHGSAEQRATWFKRGFDSGKMADCDTFASR